MAIDRSVQPTSTDDAVFLSTSYTVTLALLLWWRGSSVPSRRTGSGGCAAPGLVTRAPAPAKIKADDRTPASGTAPHKAPTPRPDRTAGQTRRSRPGSGDAHPHSP